MSRLELTEAEQYALLKCIKRLVYSKDVITKEDKEVIEIINSKVSKVEEESKQ